MSIKATILSIVHKLQTIEVQNQDGADTLLHTGIWNNDIEDLRNGNLTFPLPACMVETILENNIMIGNYNSGKDATIKIHIIHENYNNEGGLDANLLVFDLRDKILGIMAKFTPESASTLSYVTEYLDLNSDNLYHYIIDFKTHIIENLDAILDSNYGGTIEQTITNPTLQIDKVITKTK
jgi:hypothetical protein